jgi:hypothetical protein
MKTIAKWLRVHGGRKAVEPEYANEVTKVGQILAELYKFEFHSFEDRDGDKELIPVVYANTEKLVASIIKTRSYLGAMFVKVM